MHTTYTTFQLAGLTVQRLDFQPHSVSPADLLVLPHAARLNHAVPTRQAEHLAGRLAAAIALRDAGAQAVIPGIGAHREPLWPAGFIGSISHFQHTALAVAARQRASLSLIGIDGEALLDAASAQEIVDEALNPDEHATLRASGLPFALAVTLIFSAKESLFKALFPQVGDWFGFDAASAVALSTERVSLRLNSPVGAFPAGACFEAHALCSEAHLVTLVRG